MNHIYDERYDDIIIADQLLNRLKELSNLFLNKKYNNLKSKT